MRYLIEDNIVRDTKTGLIWCRQRSINEITWNEALEYCKTLEYAGYSDWRLPTVEELFTLIDFSKHDPASMLPIESSNYWSSTAHAYYTGNAWSVNVRHGFVDYYHKTTRRYVRAVRDAGVEYDMQNYRKKHLQPMEPWTPETDMSGVSVSDADRANGSPKQGDMIAVNPENGEDRWLVAADFFAANYEPAYPPNILV